MKKLLLTLVITFTLFSCTKESSVLSDDSSVLNSARRPEDNIQTPPQAVLDAFKAKFGTVKVDQWKLRSDGTWRAHFMNNGVAWGATYMASGTLVKSEPA
jgi:hypothetical protein